ncbi:type II secretion system protein GspM [Thiofilum flexile]|uniref:type II secretion system protein GspM n=1 Tax=Thiofilum flexile TaxID=125627 RepID=UPI000381FB03|nr:type II secretion system protein GspM [Thiofilum flexile]
MNDLLMKHQSLLAWSLLILLVLCLLVFGVLPAWSYSNQLSDRIETGYRQLAKMRQIANTTPEFMAEYERVKSQGLDKLFYPEGMTSAQVAKELQQQVSGVITRGNGRILSSEVVEDNKSEEEASTGYQKVTVRATFQGSMPLVRQVLHQAYQARPLIFVDSLELYPLDKDKTADSSQSQLAKADVLITTYWRGGSK